MGQPTDFITDVANYLAAQGVGSTTNPTTIFAGLFPADPDGAVGVVGNTGDRPNPYVAELKFPRFQVIVRDNDYDTGQAKLDLCRTLLHGKYGLSLAHYHILSLFADSDGAPLGQDTNGRHIFSINFRAEIRDGTT